MFRTLGYQTDALAMAGRSTFEDRGGYVIQRTPDEPDFWFGNQLIYQKMIYDNVDSLHCEFEGEFPDAEHVAFGFDIPGFDLKGWDLDGMLLDHVDVLTLQRPMKPQRLPGGLEIRRVDMYDDWYQVVHLQHDIGVEQGYDPESHYDFIQTRFGAISERCRQDGFAWFAVFDGAHLVADMGITWDKQVARYQNVETRKSHRGRGICAALLSHVSAFASFKARTARQVIVADVEGAAGRIYRRAGFEHVESLYSLHRPSY